MFPLYWGCELLKPNIYVALKQLHTRSKLNVNLLGYNKFKFIYSYIR